MPGIQHIFIDVDDCLLPTNGATNYHFYRGINAVRKWIIQANSGRYPEIGFCSGRDRNYIEAVSFFLGLPNCLSVIESGIALFNTRSKLLLLNPALTPEVIAAFTEIRQNRLPQILKKFPDLFDYPGNRINISLERECECQIPIEEFYRAIKEELVDLIDRGLATVHHSTVAVDISPANIDKASGISFFSQLTGIDTKNILGIGDSRGDFPMLNLVGYVGCPANASDECKALVKRRDGYISGFPYALGVADIIQSYSVALRN